MNLHIRKTTMNDLDTIVEIENQCFPEAEAASRTSLENRIRIFTDSFFVATVEEDEIVGFINGCITNDRTICDEMFDDPKLHIPDGDYQSIFGLDVIPEYRQRGIAGQLMKHMIQVSEKNGRKGVILTCKEHLINYYSKFGFENMGISASVHGGAQWYDMILEF